MKIEPAIARRMLKNILLSIFIYALPVLLMLLSYYFSGERPWETYQPKPVITTPKS